MKSHNDTASTCTSDLWRNPWCQAVLTGVLTLIPPRNYPGWLRRGIAWASPVIGAAGAAYLNANPEAHRKWTEHIAISDQSAEADQQNPARNATVAAAAGAAVGAVFSAGMAVSFWADEKLEQGLHRLKVPFPRAALGAAAGAATWWQVNQENQRERAEKNTSRGISRLTPRHGAATRSRRR